MSTIEEARKAAAAEAEAEARQATEQAAREAKELQAKANKAEKKADWEDLKEKAAESESKLKAAWNTFTTTPSYWAPALGAVNALIIGGLGVAAYSRKEQSKNEPQAVAGAVAVILALLGAEGYAATKKAQEQQKKSA